MSANLPVAIGDEVTADLLNEISGMADSASFLRTTSASPLTSTASTPTTIISGAYDFISGYAYEITFTCRARAIGGTIALGGSRVMLFNLARATAAGTQFYLSGRVEQISTNVIHFIGSQVVKVTNGDTTQTVCFTGQFDASGGATPTSMEVTTNGSVTPARMTIKRIGMAANHADAVELPTS